MPDPSAVSPAPAPAQLKAYQLRFLAIGAAIGSGLFVGSAQALHAAGPSLLIAYLLCAAAVYVVARCLGEMGLAFPGQSFVNHVERELGRVAGLVSGWGFWTTCVLIGMAELTAIGLVVGTLLPGIPRWGIIAMAVALLLVVNHASAGRFGTIEVAMSLLKVAVIFLFIGLGLTAIVAPGVLPLHEAGWRNLALAGGIFPNGWNGFAQALPVALFSLGGFELISLAAAETADPERAIPSAVDGLIVRFILFYLGATAALLVLMPWTEQVSGQSPFLAVLERLGTPYAAAFFAVLLASSILSSANGLLFGSARALGTLAANRAAPSWLGRSQRSGVPTAAVRATTLAISSAILLNAALPQAAFGLLMALVAIVTIVNWILIVAADLAFRQRDRTGRRHFPVPGAPFSHWAAMTFLATMLVVVLGQ